MSVIEFSAGKWKLHHGRVARLELNAPERRNAISKSMWQALPDICDAIAADDSIRAVLLVAAPASGTFSAGADITEFEQVYASEDSMRAYNTAVRTGQARLRGLPRPVIAVIDGACVGGGCGLALAADFRFASDTASFAITPARLGIAYSPEDTAQLIEKVGPTHAKDMLFSGRRLDANEALTMGLIDRILPAAMLQDAAFAYATDLTSLSKTSIQAAKTIINRLATPDANTCLELHSVFEAAFSGADFAEGRKAFLAKRLPKFE